MLLMVEHILKLSFDIIKISSLKISEVSLYNGIILSIILFKVSYIIWSFSLN